MRSRFPVLLVALSLICVCAQAQKKKVQLQLMVYEPYCGGAAPREDQQAEAATPNPFASGYLVLKKSNRSTADSVITDTSGILRLKLRRGTYQLYEPWRYYLHTPGDGDANDFDLQCLKQEWEKVAAKIVVSRKKVQIFKGEPLKKHCSWALPCKKTIEPPPGRQPQ